MRYYPCSPHAGLLGRDPATCFAEGEKVPVTEQELRAALTVRQRRRVRRDSTLSLGGTVYEVPLGYLAGQVVTVSPPAPSTSRAPERAAAPVEFDPGRSLSADSEEDADDDIF